MQVLVLEHIINQTKKGQQLSKITIKRIYEEIRTLCEQSKNGEQSLRDYLKNQNGKKLKGNNSCMVFKHRLSAGDRMLYTFGYMLPYIREEEQDSLVIIAYAKHDDQGDFKSLPKKQRYTLADEIVSATNDLGADELESFGIDDFDAFASLILENYHDNHTIYVIDTDIVTEETVDNDNWPLYLSTEQSEIIDRFKVDANPTLIMGGAGTGKTVVAVHLLNMFSNDSRKKSIYFTQSRELLVRVMSQYETLSGTSEYDNVEFFDINEYAISILNKSEKQISRSQIVQTTEFLNFLCNNKQLLRDIQMMGLTEMDIWTEIRGVIKGSLNDSWLRNRPQNALEYDGTIIKELIKGGYIIRLEEDKKLFLLGENKDRGALTKEAKILFDDLLNYYSRVDWEIEDITLGEYLQLSEETTMIEQDKREEVYSIYLKYKNWLKENDYYDENDLIRKVMNDNLANEKYDYVIIDEVQDYTELQIRFIYEISANRNGLVYAGDTHQIINPTVFSDRRLMRLHDNLVREYLEKNFRCQAEIVKLGNSIAKIRRKKIASGKHEIDERACREGKSVIRLESTTENLKDTVKTLLNFPNVAVLVAHNERKQELINLIGSDYYEKANNNIIFHISEIKGMEYKYVFVYNLISDYRDIWREILDKNSSKTTRYRYYFNLLYVAITRSQSYLSIMEKDDCKLLDILENDAPEPFTYDRKCVFGIKELNIDKLTNTVNDWLSFGDKNYEAGKYEEAKQNYIRGNASRDRIDSCDAEIAVNNKDFAEAVKLFIRLEKFDRVRQYYDELDKKSGIYRLATIMLNPRDVVKVNLSGKELLMLIKDIYNEEMNDLYEYFIIEMNSLIEEQLQAGKEVR